MKIYVSNPASQHAIFHYRDPKTNLLGQLTIPRGGQTALDRPAWSREDLEGFISQLHKYGARDAAEAHGRMEGFRQSLLYRVEGVISEDEIMAGNAADEEARQARSVEQATGAALGFDKSARRGHGRDRAPARVTETSVTRDRAPGEKKKAGDVDFSVTVDPTAHDPAERLLA